MSSGPAHAINPRPAAHHPCHGAWKKVHSRQHQRILGQAVGLCILFIVEHVKCLQDGSQASARYQHVRIRTILGTIEEPTSGLAGFPSHSTPHLNQAASKSPQKVQLVLRGTKVREGRAQPSASP